MIRLKHCLIAIGGLVMLIAAVARLNALDADAQNPPGHGWLRRWDTQQMSRPTDDSSARMPPFTRSSTFTIRRRRPFPSDIFTVADRTHNTGRRVNLPYPDCTVHVSDCEDLDVINTLDGFGLQTRISIPFDGPIDANTATKETVFLIRLGSTLRREHDHYGADDMATSSGHRHQSSCLGRADATRCTSSLTSCSPSTLATRSSSPMACATHAGRLIGASQAFRRFRQTARGEYKHALLEAIHAARRLGVRERDIVTASVYTTQSITSVMERIRDQIKAGTPAPANFLLGPTGERAVFKLPDVASISWSTAHWHQP